jgi:hypothetical protein
LENRTVPSPATRKTGEGFSNGKRAALRIASSSSPNTPVSFVLLSLAIGKCPVKDSHGKKSQTTIADHKEAKIIEVKGRSSGGQSELIIAPIINGTGKKSTTRRLERN